MDLLIWKRCTPGPGIAEGWCCVLLVLPSGGLWYNLMCCVYTELYMHLLLNTLLFKVYMQCLCVCSSRFTITSAASCALFMKTIASLTSLSVPGTAQTGTVFVF